MKTFHGNYLWNFSSLIIKVSSRVFMEVFQKKIFVYISFNLWSFLKSFHENSSKTFFFKLKSFFKSFYGKSSNMVLFLKFKEFLQKFLKEFPKKSFDGNSSNNFYLNLKSLFSNFWKVSWRVSMEIFQKNCLFFLIRSIFWTVSWKVFCIQIFVCLFLM